MEAIEIGQLFLLILLSIITVTITKIYLEM